MSAACLPLRSVVTYFTAILLQDFVIVPCFCPLLRIRAASVNLKLRPYGTLWFSLVLYYYFYLQCVRVRSTLYGIVIECSPNSTWLDTFDVLSPFMAPVSSLSNSTAQHDWLDTSNVSCWDVTSRVEFRLVDLLVEKRRGYTAEYGQVDVAPSRHFGVLY